jgi:hypothetical protein
MIPPMKDPILFIHEEAPDAKDRIMELLNEGYSISKAPCCENTAYENRGYWAENSDVYPEGAIAFR